MNATLTPCVDKHALFDSTKVDDHKRARALCATCPLIRECHQRYKETVAEWGFDGRVGPRGTWAGKLLAPGSPRKEKATKELERCGRGHERNEDNTYINPKNGRRTCRPCRQISQNGGKEVIPPAEMTHCKRGHEFTHENTQYGGDGRRRCRECRRNSPSAVARRKESTDAA